MDDLLTLIGNYAFPIVCCIALFWKLDKDQKTTQDYMEKRDELHRDEINSLREVLENNTNAILELRASMDKKGDCTP
jgi:predicted glycosyl hydrolase (DUF1957 family)